MNELFLSGTILTLVKTPTTGDTAHVVCQLRHSHRNRQQQVIHETYTVHAWKVDCQASATPKKTSKGVRQPNLLRGL